MSFDTFESSQDQGGPVQCFLFRYGEEAGKFYAYTDHTEEVTVIHPAPLGEITYEPVPCKRDEIVANGTMDRASLGLRLDIGTGLAELFRIYPPAAVVELTIFQGHLGDPDEQFLAVWAGRLMSASREGSELVMSGEPILTQMKRPGLRQNYQYGCPWWLYGPNCLASKAAATVSTTVVAIAGNVVTLAPGWEAALPPDKFVRGMVEWTPVGESTRRRMIIRRSGDALTLSGIVPDLEISDAIEVVLGCNHKAYAPEGDCQALHDNILQYGGQPRIPIKNVVNTNPFY